VKKQVLFTFAAESAAEPIIYTLGQQFNIITNIRQAEMTEDRGWIKLELDGGDKEIEEGLAWAISRGVRVDPVTE